MWFRCDPWCSITQPLARFPTFLKKIGRRSLSARLARDERTVNLALEQPILGSNQWDWWRNSGLRPSGLWLLAFGMYGLFGLLALEALQLIPIIRVVWFPFARSDIEDLNLRHAFVAVILMTAIDNLLNSAMILPLLLVMGGMSTWEAAAHAVHVEIQSPDEEGMYEAPTTPSPRRILEFAISGTGIGRARARSAALEKGRRS